MALNSKILSKVDIVGYKHYINGTDYDINLRTMGIFDSQKVHWKYYVVSTFTAGNNNNLYMTNDVGSYYADHIALNIDNIQKYGVRFDTSDEANAFIETFKMKWETSSNNTTQEIRDKKLNEIMK